MNPTFSPIKRTKPPTSQNLTLKPTQIQTNTQYQHQHQKLLKNKQRLTQLQQQVQNLKQARAKKIHELDTIQLQLKQCKQHKQVLPLIKQLREHYKKLKQQLGNRFNSQFEDDDVDVDQMSYEQLLELGQKIGKVSKGLSEAQFQKLERVICSQADKCLICQDSLVIGSQCIRLKCGHVYDTDCLKGWFQMEKVCPLCKSESI